MAKKINRPYLSPTIFTPNIILYIYRSPTHLSLTSLVVGGQRLLRCRQQSLCRWRFPRNEKRSAQLPWSAAIAPGRCRGTQRCRVRCRGHVASRYGNDGGGQWLTLIPRWLHRRRQRHTERRRIDALRYAVTVTGNRRQHIERRLGASGDGRRGRRGAQPFDCRSVGDRRAAVGYTGS